jgi:hypothetical protein
MCGALVYSAREIQRASSGYAANMVNWSTLFA